MTDLHVSLFLYKTVSGMYFEKGLLCVRVRTSWYYLRDIHRCAAYYIAQAFIWWLKSYLIWKNVGGRDRNSELKELRGKWIFFFWKEGRNKHITFRLSIFFLWMLLLYLAKESQKLNWKIKIPEFVCFFFIQPTFLNKISPERPYFCTFYVLYVCYFKTEIR